MTIENFRAAAKCGGEKVDVITIHRQLCLNTFGSDPCTATGEPCFNTFKTCRDKCNFTCANSSDTHVTRKFSGQPTEFGPQGYVPDVQSVSYRSGRVELCQTLSATNVLTVTLQDSSGCDYRDDPYIDERGHVGVFAPGTRLAKYLARNILEGRRVDYDSGYCGSSYPDDYFNNTFLVDSISGPTVECIYTLTTKDPLSLFIADKSQWPRQQEIELKSAQFNSRSQFVAITIPDDPPSVQALCIGDEAVLVEFNRIFNQAGEQVALYDVTKRAVCGSSVAFEPILRGAEINVAAYWPAGTPASQVIFDLFNQNGEGLPTSDGECNCGPFDKCLLDKQSFLDVEMDCGAVATIPETVICEPTDIDDLLEELTPFLMNVYQDDETGKVSLSQIRPPECGQEFESYKECDIRALRLRTETRDRATEIQIHTSPRDCTQGINEENLAKTIVSPTPDGLGNACGNPGWVSPRIKEITSRFFGPPNISQARLAAGRMRFLFRDAPVVATFEVHDSQIRSKKTDMILIDHPKIQNEHGLTPNTLWFVNSIQPGSNGCWQISATSTAFDTGQKWITKLTCEGDCAVIVNDDTETCGDNNCSRWW